MLNKIIYHLRNATLAFLTLHKTVLVHLCVSDTRVTGFTRETPWVTKRFSTARKVRLPSQLFKIWLFHDPHTMPSLRILPWVTRTHLHSTAPGSESFAWFRSESSYGSIFDLHQVTTWWMLSMAWGPVRSNGLWPAEGSRASKCINLGEWAMGQD